MVGELHLSAFAAQCVRCCELHIRSAWCRESIASASVVEVGARPKVVALSGRRLQCCLHASLLAVGEHAGASAVIHVVLNIVQAAAGHLVQVAGLLRSYGVRCVAHVIIVIAVLWLGVVIAVAPNVFQVEIMAYLVAQCASREIAATTGADASTLRVAHHNAFIGLAGCIAGIVGISTRSALNVVHNPHIEVAGRVPTYKVLHILACTEGECRFCAGYPIRAVTIGVFLCQTELDLRIGSYTCKFLDYHRQVAVLTSEIFVDYANSIQYLFLGDVLGAIIVNDMKNDGYHPYNAPLLPIICRGIIRGISVQLLGQCGFLRLHQHQIVHLGRAAFALLSNKNSRQHEQREKKKSSGASCHCVLFVGQATGLEKKRKSKVVARYWATIYQRTLGQFVLFTELTKISSLVDGHQKNSS